MLSTTTKNTLNFVTFFFIHKILNNKNLLFNFLKKNKKIKKSFVQVLNDVYRMCVCEINRRNKDG